MTILSNHCVITSQCLQLCKHNLHQVRIYLLAITEWVYTFLIPKISPVLGSFSRAGNNITGGSNRARYAQQYFCNKTHLKTMCKKRKLQKKITQVFIASLVGELNRQWIYPGHHRVRLSIGSTKIFVSSPYTKRFQSYRRLVTLR